MADAVAAVATFEWTHRCHFRRRPLEGPTRAHSDVTLRCAIVGAIVTSDSAVIITTT